MMRRYSLYTYLLILLLFISIVFSLLILTFVNYQRNKLIETAIQEKVDFARSISETTSSLVWTYQIAEFPGLERMFFNQIGQFPDIVFIREVGANGIIRQSSVEIDIGQKINDSDIPLITQKNKAVIIRDISYQGRDIKLVIYPSANGNTIWLGFSLEGIQARVQDIAFQIVAIDSGVFLVLISILYFLFRLIVDPLKKIISVLHKITQGDLEARIDVKSRTEIGDLALTVNKMAGSLNEAREREKTLSRMKSEFISIAAHQLRTPLSAIKWTLRMLMDGDVGKLKEEQKEFLEKGYETNERMIRLVSDLLDVARIEEGRFGYNFIPVNLEKIVESEINNTDLIAQKRNITVALHRPSNPLPQIKIDPEKISLALENLLDNAVNYTTPGGSIDITLQRKEDFIEVVIKDTGVGIPKNQMNRLFTKFFRGENVVRMQTEGSGLGLFIVKNIIKRHGGEIWAESEEGKGTAFHFTLPIEERMIPKKEEVFEEFIKGF